MPRKKEASCKCPETKLQKYFKLGVSKDFILIRDDFPIANISPGEFSRLCMEMFRKNDEVCNAEK